MIRNLALAACSFFLSLVLVLSGIEIYLRRTGYEPLLLWYPGERQNVFDPKHAWVEDDETLGWVFRKNADWVQKNRLDKLFITYTANSEGFRDRKPMHAPKVGRRILTVGDSFTFGWGSAEEDRFTNAAERLLGKEYEIYNIAVPGWGFDQMYLALEKYAPVLSPDLVIVVYISDDLNRSLTAFRDIWDFHTKPLLEIQDGKLVPRRRGANPLEKFFRKSMAANLIFRKILFPAYKTRLNAGIADAMMRLAEERKIPILFVKIPMKGDYLNDITYHRKTDEGGDVLMKHLLKKGVPFLDMTPILIQEGTTQAIFPYNYPADPHLNAFGNGIVAREIAEKVRSLLGEVPRPQTSAAPSAA